MKCSYNWLQKYFDKSLPPPEELSDLFTFRFCEVESVERVGGDTVFDLKILPDRANYALSHRGIANEVSAICRLKLKPHIETPAVVANSDELSIKISEQNLCRRYIGVLLENIEVKKDEALSEPLSRMGQRTVNNIVDMANYLMFDIGQPLHAFDADKVKGGITVRLAKKGETIVVLDDIKYVLDETMLVIADVQGPLAIAGIKGGKRAEVSFSTKRLILEAANFEPTQVRRTSAKLSLRTDAEKRFENRVPVSLAEDAMRCFVKMVCDSQDGRASVKSYIDRCYVSETEKSILLRPSYVNSLLGVKMADKMQKEILSYLRIEVDESNGYFKLRIPRDRQDLEIPEDIVEEIGRLYGYENIKPVKPKTLSVKGKVLKLLYLREKVKDYLVRNGFSEVITYSFVDKGDLSVIKSASSDKKYLRTELAGNIDKALESNLINAHLLELSQVKVFEIGKVFTSTGEHTSLCAGIRASKGIKSDPVSVLRKELMNLAGYMNVEILLSQKGNSGRTPVIFDNKVIGYFSDTEVIFEINLDELMDSIDEPRVWDFEEHENKALYKNISLYPFISRDVAVYVSIDDSFSKVADVVRRLAEKGEMPNLVKIPQKPFDEYINKKIDKKSFALRLIFQSHDRTLTDNEINKLMENLYGALKTHEGWQIR